MLAEVAKLSAVRAVGLPAGLFADVAPKVVAGWPGQRSSRPATCANTLSPPGWRCWPRCCTCANAEITDTLVDLLISTVHRINARAEKKVVEEFVKDFRGSPARTPCSARSPRPRWRRPTTRCATVIYPVVGGETTLRDLVAEYRATGTEYQRNKRRVFKASYTNHYRRGLIKLLGVLEFRSNNTAHRPVIDALDLIVRHAGASARFYPPDEPVVARRSGPRRLGGPARGDRLPRPQTGRAHRL